MQDDRSIEIAAMQTAVAGFQWTTLDRLRLLIDELETRASRIRGCNPEWDQNFRQPWEALEEVYAVMVDRGISMPDTALKQVINSSVDKLKAVLCVSDPIPVQRTDGDGGEGEERLRGRESFLSPPSPTKTPDPLTPPGAH